MDKINEEKMPEDHSACELSKKQLKINEKKLKEQNDLKNTEISVNIINDHFKRRIESMTDEEIIQENLKELLEKKSREERKANGRLVAVILVFLVLFLAIYHVWSSQTTALAGVLVPAVIMLSYGGWVVILTKRDKQKRALFEKHLEEIVSKNKTELAKLKEQKKQMKAEKKAAKMHLENEKLTDPEDILGYGIVDQKQKRQKNKRMDSTISSGYSTLSSTSSASLASTMSLANVRTKRPSFREKLFKQKAAHNIAEGMVRAVGPATTVAPLIGIQADAKQHVRKPRIQRLNDLPKLHLARQVSVP